MGWENNTIDLLAAELIRGFGIHKAKSLLFRFSFEWGKQAASQKAHKIISGSQVPYWQATLQSFLQSQGLTEINIQYESGRFVARVSGRFAKKSSQILLRPWVLAGWCSGCTSIFFEQRIFFQVTQLNPHYHLVGKIGADWTEMNAEPIIDYYCWSRPDQDTRSLAMRVCLDRLCEIAPNESCIFLQIDRKDSPDQLARFIHDHSQRSEGVFVFLEAKSLTLEIFENALHSAAQGSLFIFAIEATPLALQRKLVESLAPGPANLNFRLIAASERSLSSLHREKRLTVELVRLLQGHEVLVPSLRKRMEDMVPLAKRYLQQLSSKVTSERMQFSPAVLNEFLHYPWPGGTQELQEVIASMLEQKQEGELVLDVVHLPVNFGGNDIFTGNYPFVGLSLAEVERKAILSTLQQVRGNKQEASRLLKIGYNTLWRKLKSYEDQERKGRNRFEFRKHIGRL